MKWIGVLIVMAGCGGVGFSIAAAHRQEVRNFRQYIRVLEFMECELEYRLTSLPELCRQAQLLSSGIIRQFFALLTRELGRQISPDAARCVSAALSQMPELSPKMRCQLENLGATLGRFGLTGQIRELKALREQSSRELERLTANQDERIRSYQTLGLCAGAAIAILFL